VNIKTNGLALAGSEDRYAF